MVKVLEYFLCHYTWFVMDAVYFDGVYEEWTTRATAINYEMLKISWFCHVS